jgi:hypothetical protein
MGETRSAYTTLVAKPLGNRPLEYQEGDIRLREVNGSGISCRLFGAGIVERNGKECLVSQDTKFRLP